MYKTPPNSATKIIIPSRSESDISNINTEEIIWTPSNVTQRTKRLRPTDDCTLMQDRPVSMSEIKLIFAELQTKQDLKLEQINNTLSTLVNQYTDIQKSFINITSQNQELLKNIIDLQKENNQHKSRISTLENQLDQLEKKQLSTSIEIRNIPKQGTENKAVITEIINKISSTLSIEPPIQESEIKNAYRSKSAAIVVEFTTTHRQETVISQYKIYNKTRRELKEPQLNSTSLNLSGESRRIFISESLSHTTKKLFYEARQYVKDNKLTAAWTAHGKLYAKKDEASTPVRIDVAKQIANLVI